MVPIPRASLVDDNTAPSLNLDDWSGGQIAGCVLGAAGGVVLVYAIFLLPYLHRKLVLEDWTLKPWMVIQGPLLWRRGPVPPKPEGYDVAVVQDYYRGHKTKENLSRPINIPPTSKDAEKQVEQSTGIISSDNDSDKAPTNGTTSASPLEQVDDNGPWYHPANLYQKGKHYFFRGVNHDIVDE